LVQFFQNYNIELGHSTAYYPQGNGLVESSNKNLIKIIKKMLSQNKKAWDSHLKYAVWADIVNIKGPLELLLFSWYMDWKPFSPFNSILPMMKLLQDEEAESYDMQRRINQLIEVQQVRE
jgi:hypothetical protein